MEEDICVISLFFVLLLVAVVFFCCCCFHLAVGGGRLFVFVFGSSFGVGSLWWPAG